MGNPNPPKRGKVIGWSAAAARRNTNFLRSVDERQLGPFGFAATLTVRKCPETPAAWTAAVRAWLERQRRAGLQRLHWVMEFQRRAVPHLHVAAWYDEADVLRDRVRLLERGGPMPWATPRGMDGASDSALLVASKLVTDWCACAADFEAGPKGQHVRPIDGPVGWFQYMAKHCSRSRIHYQRQRDAVPKSWASSPRVWGKVGEWPVLEPKAVRIGNGQFHRLRRLVRQSRLSEARAGLPLNGRQVSALRRMLKSNDRAASSVRPVSEWMPEDQQRRLLLAAAGA